MIGMAFAVAAVLVAGGGLDDGPQDKARHPVRSFRLAQTMEAGQPSGFRLGARLGRGVYVSVRRV